MTTTNDRLRAAVKDRYGRIAVTDAACCEAPASHAGGYDPAELAGLPEEALMGLGCGTPVQLADIHPGDVVLDLGSGGGIDVFLAAQKAGPAGRVIGVDMTPEMIERAEANAARAGIDNVEFRQGLIEDLPVADDAVDVVISNCVINLSPDKAAVFVEAARALRPGGRLVVSDIVGTPPGGQEGDPDSWAACIGGAIPEEDYLAAIGAAGLGDVEVLTGYGYEGALRSVTVRAVKPG